MPPPRTMEKLTANPGTPVAERFAMEEPNYRALFEAAPGLYLALDRELRVVAASDAFLRTTMVARAAIVGRPVFEVFPGGLGSEQDSQQGDVRAALQEVVRTRTPQSIAEHKYDIARPAVLGGGFDERYWSILLIPVLGDDRTVCNIISV